jgi:hypothetical protein
VGDIAHRAKERQVSSKVKGMRRRRSLATAVGRAALWCGRGAGPTGAGDENLRQYKLGEPLANPRRKKEGRQSLSFTSDGEDTAAAKNRGIGNGEWEVLERVCLQKVGKGASRSSSTTLNSHQEGEGGETRRRDHAAAGACH